MYTLVVEGPAQAAASSLPQANNLPCASSLVTVSSTPTTSSLPPPPTFRSVTAPRWVPSFSLKMLKAKLTKNGRQKPDFEPLNQTYIELVESTANLEHILVLVRRRWGSEYTIVKNDGIELEDSPATQVLYDNNKCLHVCVTHDYSNSLFM